MTDSELKFATIREGGDTWDIECRFANGEKYSAVSVDIEKEKLAHDICDFLNKKDPSHQLLVDALENMLIQFDAVTVGQGIAVDTARAILKSARGE